MKLSRLKQIIAEQLRQLKEQKSLITEGCTLVDTLEPATCSCYGTGQGGQCQGTKRVQRFANCNWKMELNCACCLSNIHRGGGDKAPMGTSIG